MVSGGFVSFGKYGVDVMVATIYTDEYASNYAVYLDQKYEFETYTLEKAIQIAKLLGDGTN